MRNNQIRLFRLKRKILNSKKDLVLSLTNNEIQYLQDNNIGMKIIPYVYRIKTKRVLPRLQKVNNIFKEIDFACQEGKEFLYKVLLPSEVEVLKFYEYNFVPYKYRVLYPEGAQYL